MSFIYDNRAEAIAFAEAYNSQYYYFEDGVRVWRDQKTDFFLVLHNSLYNPDDSGMDFGLALIMCFPNGCPYCTQPADLPLYSYYNYINSRQS